MGDPFVHFLAIMGSGLGYDSDEVTDYLHLEALSRKSIIWD